MNVLSLLVISAALAVGAHASDAKQASGRATQEVNQLSSKVKESSERVASFYGDLTELGAFFSEESKVIRGVVQDFQKAPTKKHRRRLKLETKRSIDRVVERTGILIRQREGLLTRILDVESACGAKAIEYRKKAEQMDQASMETQEKLVALQIENDAIKDQYLADPGNKQLRRELRRRHAREAMFDIAARRDSRRRQLMTRGADRLEATSQDFESLFDQVDSAFRDLDIVQAEAKDTSILLSDILAIEQELGDFLGGKNLLDLMSAVSNLQNVTRNLSDAVESAVSVALEREPGEYSGGPAVIAPSGFEDWLNTRVADQNQ